MDVTDVKPKQSLESANNSRQAAQKPATQLSADKVNVARTETVRTESVRVEVTERSERSNQSREKANDVISTLNVVADVTDELDKIVTSLSGLAEQASDGALPESRRKILEDEAQQLLQAIDDRSRIETDGGIKPLQGDPIELEVEAELGKTLEVILPETSRDQLGLGQVSVSRVDTIISTRASIEEARARLEELRDAVAGSQSEVQKVLQEADIASQNREAAETSIRDVDAALELTGGIQGIIAENPEVAIEASAVDAESARLLSE